MESLDARLKGPKIIANWLIYASVILGVPLIVQLYPLVPSWLFYSVLAGWIAYLITGLAAALHKSAAYPLSLVLAVLTLAVSLPRPEHYMFGFSIASLTFIAGSVLQVGVIVSVTRYLFLKKRSLERPMS
ncbi:MAG TPA: hypothetical protein VF906_07565 [Candidatus Bathyarchaeia archaeon]